MKKIYCSVLGTLFFLFYASSSFAQDTFSICAYDSATGQVGSAGATCINASYSGVWLISDIHPGVGVIHTQAYWQQGNQAYGRQLMNMGTLTPQQIIDSLLKHDSGTGSGIGQDTTYRQYGIVDMVHKQTAQFTGSNCDTYKNHIKGLYYSIQGNTLSYKGDISKGQWVLDSIEYHFLNTPGTLACRLMAALQGAKWQGADKRCNPYGVSTLSAILRVANPWDSPDSLCASPTSLNPCPGTISRNMFLDLYVNTASQKTEPIDSLQKLFDAWGGCAKSTYVSTPAKNGGLLIFPNPTNGKVRIQGDRLPDASLIKVSDLLGNVLKSIPVNDPREVAFDISTFSKGIYFLTVEDATGRTMISSRLIKE